MVDEGVVHNVVPPHILAEQSLASTSWSTLDQNAAASPIGSFQPLSNRVRSCSNSSDNLQNHTYQSLVPERYPIPRPSSTPPGFHAKYGSKMIPASSLQPANMVDDFSIEPVFTNVTCDLIVNPNFNDSGLLSRDASSTVGVMSDFMTCADSTSVTQPCSFSSSVFQKDDISLFHNQRDLAPKRPHSALDQSSEISLIDSRPHSAPKRLFGNQITESTALASISDRLEISSTLERIKQTPTPLIEGRTSSVPPKSTLEALVASNSPLLFFSSNYLEDVDNDTGGPLSELLCNEISPNGLQSNPSIKASSSNPDEDVPIPESICSTPSNISAPKSLDPTVDLNTNSHSDAKSPSTPLFPKSSPSERSMATPSPQPCVESLSTFVDAMRSYAAELCPVDCVILMEQCRPFNCDTLYMKYFRDQYLCPILSNLNGGPPLNADFGQDAYTSLYSLHGFDWRSPCSLKTWIPNTPIIYRILKRIATVQHEERHACKSANIMGHQLLRAAVEAFDSIDHARRGLCKQVQRHLIMLTLTPINLNGMKQNAMEDENSPLINLRRRGVSLSCFSPIRSNSLSELYEMFNAKSPSFIHDKCWDTVALSPKLLSADAPDRRIIGPMAADSHSQAEAEQIALEQHHHQKQYSSKSATPSILNGSCVKSVGPSASHNRFQIQTGIAADPNRSSSGNAHSVHRSPSIAEQDNVSSLQLSSHQGSTDDPVGSTESTVPRVTRPNALAYGPPPSSYPQRTNVHPQHLSYVSGDSGPNSVELHGPGSIHFSESVTTPQGLLSVNNPSPQQLQQQQHPAYTTNPNQLLSPITAAHNQTHCPTSVDPQLCNIAGEHISPSGSLPPFRPPSNSASPNTAAQVGLHPANQLNVPSPSTIARASRQPYSPHMSAQSQAAGVGGVMVNQIRRTSPHPVLQTNPPLRTHPLTSPDQLSNGSFVVRPCSITPTNPMSNAYGSKDGLSNVPTGWCPTTNVASSSSFYDQSAANYRPMDNFVHNSPDQRPPPGVPCGMPDQLVMTGDVGTPGKDMMTRRGEYDQHTGTSRQPFVVQQVSPFDHQQVGRAILWEGQVHWNDWNSSNNPVGSGICRLPMRLIWEQLGNNLDISHLNMQLWGSTAQLSIIMAQSDSILVQRLSNPLPGGNFLNRVLVDLPPSEEAYALTSALSNSMSSASLPLGILSPPAKSLPSTIAPGAVAFVCLNYSPTRGRIFGLIPPNSEQFRMDLPSAVRPSGKPSTNGPQLPHPQQHQTRHYAQSGMLLRPTTVFEANEQSKVGRLVAPNEIPATSSTLSHTFETTQRSDQQQQQAYMGMITQRPLSNPHNQMHHQPNDPHSRDLGIIPQPPPQWLSGGQPMDQSHLPSPVPSGIQIRASRPPQQQQSFPQRSSGLLQQHSTMPNQAYITHSTGGDGVPMMIVNSSPTDQVMIQQQHHQQQHRSPAELLPTSASQSSQQRYISPANQAYAVGNENVTFPMSIPASGYGPAQQQLNYSNASNGYAPRMFLSTSVPLNSYHNMPSEQSTVFRQSPVASSVYMTGGQAQKSYHGVDTMSSGGCDRSHGYPSAPIEEQSAAYPTGGTTYFRVNSSDIPHTPQMQKPGSQQFLHTQGVYRPVRPQTHHSDAYDIPGRTGGSSGAFY